MDHVLKRFCNRHHIVLRKGENLRILTTLAWNKVLLAKLHLYKWLHGIHHPIVHYYAVCWNEEKMLPFMFNYYKQFVEHFTIYDNCSDDGTEEIVKKHKSTTIIRFETDGFNDNIHNNIKNECWKKSRGKADYVVVCDLDEFIYHDDMEQALKLLVENRYSIVKPYGYNMYSTEYPIYDAGQLLTDQIKCGVRSHMFDKCILFNPHYIVEVNYEPGAHECHPWGQVKQYRSEDFKLLHYKNIGLDQLLERNRTYAARLSKVNIENNFGMDYLKKEQSIIMEFKFNEQQATEII